MGAVGAGAAIAFAVVAVLAGCSPAASPSPAASASLPAATQQPSVAGSAPAASPSAVTPSLRPSASSGDLAELLRAGPWRIVSATGIADVDRLSPVEFREALLVGKGVCGFASDVAFPTASAIDVVEVYWDSVICKDNDPADSRNSLKAILEAVTSARVSSDGSVDLSGPAGEVVLSR